MKPIRSLVLVAVATLIPLAVACGARQPASTSDDLGDGGGRKVDDPALLPTNTEEPPPIAPRVPPVAKTSEEPKSVPAPTTKGSN